MKAIMAGPAILRLTDAVKLLADGLALVCHEARHVRHLVRAGRFSGTGWERILSVPTNRVEAWQAIQVVRGDAAKRQTAGEAIDLIRVHATGTTPTDLNLSI